MLGLVFLMFVTEESEILFNFLVLMLNFAIFFKVVGSNEASFDTKTFIESLHELGCKLWTVIGEDFLQDSMEAENVPIVKIGSTFGC
jgi:hypothetical protein